MNKFDIKHNKRSSEYVTHTEWLWRQIEHWQVFTNSLKTSNRENDSYYKNNGEQQQLREREK